MSASARFGSRVLEGGVLVLWLAAIATAAETRSAVMEVFIRGDRDRSKAAGEFVERTYARREGLMVVIRDVAASDTALQRFYKLATGFEVAEPGLPAFFLSGRFICGWDSERTPAWLEEQLTIEFFGRTGCPRCAAANPVVFEKLAPRYPGYRFVEHNLAESPEAQRRLQELSQRYQVQAPSVPALHLCGRLMVGFLDPETSFRQWDGVLQMVTVPTPSKASQGAMGPRRPEDNLRSAAPRARRGVAFGGEPPPVDSGSDLPPPSADKLLAPQLDPLPDRDADSPPNRASHDLPPEISIDASPLTHPGGSAPHAEMVALPLLGDVNWREWGLPAFTVIVGLIDGFNPCAMWVLLFLLSLLVNLHDRWKILAVAGTFVVISGAAYLAFMAAWLNVFQLIGLLRPAQILLGLLAIGVGSVHIKDFFAFHRGLTLSIPETVKPRLYERMRKIVMAETLLGAILGASVLAVLVNVVELLCTAGLPAMYTGILTLQNLPAWQNYLYLLLYIVGYMFDDTLMVVIVVVTLGKTRLQERGGADPETGEWSRDSGSRGHHDLEAAVAGLRERGWNLVP